MKASVPQTAAAHLTDDQIDEILMDFADPQAIAHAAACPHCHERLENFRASVAVFNHASLEWSQARSHTLTRDLTAHLPARPLTRTALWSYASAAVVAAALLATVGLQHHTGSQPNAVAVTAGADYASSRQQEIASDNAMLSAISSELSRPDPIPAAIYDDVKSAQPHADSMKQVTD